MDGPKMKVEPPLEVAVPTGWTSNPTPPTKGEEVAEGVRPNPPFIPTAGATAAYC